MKKFRCGKCGEIFVGRLEICPKCGTELHYLDEEVKKETKVVKQGPKFHFEDEDVIKTGIKEEELVNKPVAKEKVEEEKIKRVFTDESYFDGKTGRLALLKLMTLILSILTLTLAYPWLKCAQLRWQCKHTVINGYRLAFDGKGSQLFGRYLLWLLLTILTVGLFLFSLANRIKKWQSKHTVFADYLQK